MPYPFTVRRAVPTDRDAVLRLVAAISPTDWVLDAWDDFMRMPEPEGLYLAEQDGLTLGSYCLELPAPGDAYLGAMRIDPAVQGRGLGALLCRAQVEQARALGAETCYLISLPENRRAHHTVAKVGYENLGGWVVYAALRDLPLAGRPSRARPGLPADAPLLEPFLQSAPLREVITQSGSAWTHITAQPAHWAPAGHIVVPAPGGAAIEGIMLLDLTPPNVTVRRLLGSPEAAADLLAYAADAGRSLGCTSWTFSLPAACEPLLAPLGLNPADAFRAYVFRLEAGRELPPLVEGG